MAKRAYRTVEAAQVEAAERFGPSGWRRIRLAYQSTRPELDSLNRDEAGIARTRSAIPPLDRAAKQLRRAAAAVARAAEAWRPISPGEAGVPPRLLALGALAASVEQTAADTRAFVEAAHGPQALGKQWLVRTADKMGARGRAADWCYVFIALGLDAPEPEAYGFTKRVSSFAADAKKAGLPIVR